MNHPATTHVRLVDNREIATFSLSQNYPNPFNPDTEIDFALTATGFVTLVVYDLLGREVATLVHEMLQPGTYKVTYHAGGLASGIYLCRLQQGQSARTIRMALVR